MFVINLFNLLSPSMEVFFFRLIHNRIAKPIAPPKTPTASHPKPLDLGASPDCKAGDPPAVPVAVPPEPSVAVVAPPTGCTTVTAVTVDWLPSGRVVVCRDVDRLPLELLKENDVVEDGLPDFAGRDEPLSPRVTTPPSTVLTTVIPWALVVVTICPDVTEEDVDDVTTGPGPLGIETDEPGAEEVGAVEVEVVVTGGSSLVGDVSIGGVGPDWGTGVGNIGLDDWPALLGSTVVVGLSGAYVTADMGISIADDEGVATVVGTVVVLLLSRLAMETMLAARGGSS